MGRQRNKQNQTARIYYRERDHREVIMDDSYHGAMYLPDQVEPVWRRYKPRLVMGSVVTSENSSSGHNSHLVTVDVENKYFTMLTYIPDYYQYVGVLRTVSCSRIFIPNKDIIWVYYAETYLDRGDGGFPSCGLISKNGYDWKPMQYWPLPPGVHNYGQHERVFGDGHFIFDDQTNLYSVYDFDYQEGENVATIICLGSVPRNNVYGYAIAPINTEQYSGYISYKNTTTYVIRNRIYYYTYKYDVNIYDYLSSSWVNIYHKDGASNVQAQAYDVDRLDDVRATYCLNDQIFFIECWTKTSQSTGMTTQRFVCVHSPMSNINLNSWTESEFFSWEYRATPSSSADYYVNRLSFIMVRNDTVYLYMVRHFSANNEKWALFKTSNLIDWEEIVLPDYLDVPYFNEDNSNGKYGVVVESEYDYVRIPISMSALNNVPSNIVLATDDYIKIFGGNMGFLPTGYGNNEPISEDVWFEILDGKITTDVPSEDLWIFDVCPNTIIYIDNMTFSESSNNCAYAIYEPKTIETIPDYHYDIHPYKEPIDESDYIFNS